MQPRIVIDFDGDSDGGGGGASPSRQAPFQQPQQPPADMLRSIQTMRLALKRLEQQKQQQQQHVAASAGTGAGAPPAGLGASSTGAGGVIDKQASLQAQASNGLQAACLWPSAGSVCVCLPACPIPVCPMPVCLLAHTVYMCCMPACSPAVTDGAAEAGD